VVYVGDKEGRDSGREGQRGRERRREFLGENIYVICVFSIVYFMFFY
jgi:hypothetical protein